MDHCPKCGKKFAATVMIAGTIFAGCTCIAHEYVRHDDLPETPIYRPLNEPPVPQVTSSNTTITPGSGSITLTNSNTTITPGSGSIRF